MSPIEAPYTRDLTDLQLDLLEVLWERGEATVAQVHEALVTKRGLAATTIATILSRLEKRGIVHHRAEGRVYVYRAIVSRDQVRNTQVSALAERLFEGDVTEMVNHLITTAQITPGDIARVRRMLERHGRESEAEHD